MIARGFKPVGWVAGVAAAALSCYMLSLNVAAERAELAKLERRIIMAKRDIRTLQTELGTRGRLQQLESWNANVLALSAPTSAQFLDNELTLARFDQREKTIEERSIVQMASAGDGRPEPKPQAPLEAPVRYAAAPAQAAAASQPLLHRASLTVGAPRPSEAGRPPEPKPAAAEPKKAAAEPKKAALEPKKVAAASKKRAAEPKKAAELKKPAPATKLAGKTAEPKPTPKKSSLIDQGLVAVVREAAKAEQSGSPAGR